MAIALDGGFPDASAGRAVGQQRLAGFGRRRARDGLLALALSQDFAAHRESTGDEAVTSPAAHSDSSTPVRPATPGATCLAEIDVRLVKESFAHVLTDPHSAMEHFYARLFAQSPEIRALFPLAMGELRERVFGSLSHLVSSLDAPEACLAFLRQIGRDHRKFGVKDKFHSSFFRALVATVEQFSGDEWSTGARAAWDQVAAFADATLREAAEADAAARPPWWLGEIVAHDRRTAAVAVLTIRPDQPLDYLPGQYLDVQVPRWPRLWRSYSIANAPRTNGLLDLHVKTVPGGMVSNALVHHVGPGDVLLLGPARGAMTAPAEGGHDLLFLAGGTGLAPVKAIIEAVIEATARGPRRAITLLVGARTHAELYDMRDLLSLQAAYPTLTVIPALSDEPDYQGLTGTLPEILAARPEVGDSEIYISGPDAMVAEAARLLAGRVAAGQLHHDPLRSAPTACPADAGR